MDLGHDPLFTANLFCNIFWLKAAAWMQMIPVRIGNWNWRSRSNRAISGGMLICKTNDVCRMDVILLNEIRLPAHRPARDVLEGPRVRLEPVMRSRHLHDLFVTGHEGEAGKRVWDWLGYGPFVDEAAMGEWLDQCSTAADPLFFAIVDRSDNRAKGMCSFLRIAPEQGTIEIGHIWFSPGLQKTASATEGLFLLMDEAMSVLGYRRLEWKCNAENHASREAALRLGFTFEGIFRQHLVVKGRNRDTAWFSILDNEWPVRRKALLSWLAPENFDSDGRQKRSLERSQRSNA